jgi:two-component system, NarL family, nitrate/nitrite response regulator NarL
MTPVRVLIAHHGLMRLSVRMALETENEIIGEAGDAEQAVLQAGRLQPDVSIVGWDIAGEGLNAIHGILGVAPRTSVIVLSESSDVDDLLASVRAGAVGYLPGSLDEDQLRRVVRGVVANEAAVPRAMVRELIQELRTATALGGLTDREAQVLGMLRRGHSTADIATRLKISPVTVRRYISDLVRKLDVSSRAELVNQDYSANGPTPHTGGASKTDDDARADRDVPADCPV